MEARRHMRRATANHAQSGPTSFSIVLARIGISDKHAAEHGLRFGEVDSLFTDVCPVLGFVAPRVPTLQEGAYRLILLFSASVREHHV
jgi:hypothetical protein